ncbi:MAG TPA: 30S ribosomal protein S9 [Catalimonadaceae bacterium]|jgi:small subunit ribosomal protein S9|nr:30S ribosomal protein S9 [Catalimonadaceae bacterium]HPI10041.1 30S ribosomal protein S9 [Catalimonadaceae bacterium]
MQQINNIGRRKTAVARVYLRPGSGNITVNNKDFKVYFPSDVLQIIVNQPIELVSEMGKFDFFVNVKGGGVSGQAQAVRMGIARSLVESSPENRSVIKKEGYLTRDSRMVERKKFGRKKARRSFQFSKR